MLRPASADLARPIALAALLLGSGIPKRPGANHSRFWLRVPATSSRIIWLDQRGRVSEAARLSRLAEGDRCGEADHLVRSNAWPRYIRDPAGRLPGTGEVCGIALPKGCENPIACRSRYPLRPRPTAV